LFRCRNSRLKLQLVSVVFTTRDLCIFARIDQQNLVLQLAVYADVASLTLIPRMDGLGENPPGTPLIQPADPDKYLLLAETHAALQAEVKVTFDAFLKSGGHDVALYDMVSTFVQAARASYELM
jgi:hypothetical protein